MFKRLNLLAISLLSLAAVSCDKQTSAELVLSIGINAVSDSPLASLQNTLPTEAPCDSSCARQAANRLLELRTLQESGGPADAAGEQAEQLVQEIAGLVTEAQAATGSRLVVALLEAQLAALGVAAQLDPARYRSQRDEFHRKIIEDYSAGLGSDRESVQRVIEVLSQNRISANARDLVVLHAVTYPDCDMNVELFLTATMQLAAQRKIPEAIDVAEEGLALCHVSDVRPLNDRLQELYTEHPQMKISREL